MDFEVKDANGTRIDVGARVFTDAELPHGTVTLITDPDGDVNDHGRAYGIAPKVHVAWDDMEGPEEFGTTSTAQWYTDPENYVCDDIEVAL